MPPPDESIRSTLLEQLGSSERNIRNAAIEAFSALPAEEAVPVLFQALYDPANAGKRNAALEVLRHYGAECLPFLDFHLTATDPDVRLFLISLIADLKDQTHLPFVISSLQDPEENIVSAAIHAIGRIGEPSAAFHLIPFLQNSNLWLQFQAVEAAGSLKAPVLIPHLIPLLHSSFCRKAAIRALAKFQHKQAYAALISILIHDRACDFDVLDSLLRLYHSSETRHQQRIRTACSITLDGAGIDALRAQLKSSSRTDQFRIAQVLAWCGDAEGLQLLHDFESDPQCAEQALRTLQSVRALGPFAVPFPMSDSNFRRLIDLVYSASGVRFDDSSRYMISRRLSKRVEELNLSSFENYLSYLVDGPAHDAEMEHVIEILTTHETYFFREERQLRAFSEEILPQLLEDRKQFRTLRIWSAGCSSGEEPYTIAILCRENHDLRGWNVSIVATDISQHMLAQARCGRYGDSSFRSTPDALKNRYFECIRPGIFTIKDDVKRLVTFLKLNLMDENQLGILAEADVIFCRNVLIYFDPESKKRVLETFFHKLRKGGYLLLGHSESLLTLSTRFQLCHLKHDLVYQK